MGKSAYSLQRVQIAMQITRRGWKARDDERTRVTSITWNVTVKNYLKELPHTSVLRGRPCSMAKDEPRFRVPEGHARLSKPVTEREIARSVAGFIRSTRIDTDLYKSLGIRNRGETVIRIRIMKKNITP